MAGSAPDREFEDAADAIVEGDLAALRTLLMRNPALVHARSTRQHRSNLLHYVSANGVEDERQKTPPNILDITRLLLDSGADVNAESDAYAGRSTTLMLAATSCHPENAGLQLPLLQLLIDRGALIDGPDGTSVVLACLHNGRGAAARFLAGKGAHLDLEGAAGVGRIDLVRTAFHADGSLKPPATRTQLQDGFTWACQFGWTEVAAYLLAHGVPINARLRHHGQTGLHWAAYGGHPETVSLLLESGAETETRDASFDGTPLEWALYAWGNATVPGRWLEVAALLVRHGARHDPGWFASDRERQRAADKLRADPGMQAALRGDSAVT